GPHGVHVGHDVHVPDALPLLVGDLDPAGRADAALHTSRSTGPNRSSVRRTDSSTSASTATSAPMGRARSPSSPATLAAASASASTTATPAAPSATKRRHRARPMPLPPPLTHTT